MRLPALRTARLVLEPFQRRDVDILHTIWTDADVRRHLWDDQIISRTRAAETVDAAVASAEAAGIGMWTIRPAATADLVIGFCGLRYLPDSADVELLYGLLPDYWRRGFAAEASQAVLRDAFSRLGLSKVFAGADPGNVRSFAVMRRLGMTPIGAAIPGVPGALYYAIEATAFAGAARDPS